MIIFGFIYRQQLSYEFNFYTSSSVCPFLSLSAPLGVHLFLTTTSFLPHEPLWWLYLPVSPPPFLLFFFPPLFSCQLSSPHSLSLILHLCFCLLSTSPSYLSSPLLLSWLFMSPQLPFLTPLFYQFVSCLLSLFLSCLLLRDLTPPH